MQTFFDCAKFSHIQLSIQQLIHLQGTLRYFDILLICLYLPCFFTKSILFYSLSEMNSKKHGIEQNTLFIKIIAAKMLAITMLNWHYTVSRVIFFFTFFHYRYQNILRFRTKCDFTFIDFLRFYFDHFCRYIWRSLFFIWFNFWFNP